MLRTRAGDAALGSACSAAHCWEIFYLQKVSLSLARFAVHGAATQHALPTIHRKICQARVHRNNAANNTDKPDAGSNVVLLQGMVKSQMDELVECLYPLGAVQLLFNGDDQTVFVEMQTPGKAADLLIMAESAGLKMGFKSLEFTGEPMHLSEVRIRTLSPPVPHHHYHHSFTFPIRAITTGTTYLPQISSQPQSDYQASGRGHRRCAQEASHAPHPGHRTLCRCGRG